MTLLQQIREDFNNLDNSGKQAGGRLNIFFPVDSMALLIWQMRHRKDYVKRNKDILMDPHQSYTDSSQK